MGGRGGLDIEDSPQGPFFLPYQTGLGSVGKIGSSNAGCLGFRQAGTVGFSRKRKIGSNCATVGLEGVLG